MGVHRGHSSDELQHLQNRVLHTVGGLHRCTPVCEMHMAFKIPYMYGYITKLCRRQAEAMQTHWRINNDILWNCIISGNATIF
jgi:hypothetical protein